MIKLYKIFYEIELIEKGRLHIGSGYRIYTLNPVMNLKYIPGNTLKGLLCTSYIKMFCSQPKIDCDKCSEKCDYYRFIAVNEFKHGLGIYFNYGEPYPSNFLRKRFRGIGINRRNKKTCRGILFEYEYYENIRLIKSSINILYKDEEKLKKYINFIEKALKASEKGNIGGRRSWGWGSIKRIKFYKRKYRLEEIDRNTIEIEVKTPIPIIEKTSFKKLFQKYFTEIANAFKININIDIEYIKTSKFNLIPVTGWNLKENKPRKTYLGLISPNIEIKFNKIDKEILKIIQATGITPNGYWFTKTGYGAIKYK